MDFKGRQTAAGDQPGPHDPARLDARRREQGAGGSQAKQSAEIILIPKQLRMEWTDVMALDPELPALAFRVACVIGHHFNRHRGDTFVGQDTIAGILRLDPRTVRRVIGELETRGYLIVRRRELGKRETDGRRVCGGRGVANTYLPAFEGQQVAATNTGRRLADRAEQIWSERRARESSIAAEKEGVGVLHSRAKGGRGSPPFESERRTSLVGKEGVGVLPTLEHPTDVNPPRGIAGARGIAPAHPLGKAASVLASWIGEVPFRSWFSDVRSARVEGDTLIVGAPSRFNREWLQTHYAQQVLQCWNRTNPPVLRVEFEVRP